MTDRKPTGTDIHPEAIALYDRYVHGDLPRRNFLKQLAGIAGSAAGASALAALFEPNYAWGQQVPGDDPRLETAYVDYSGVDGSVRAYLAKPIGTNQPLPGVLIIHENRGLNAHIEDVARRAALAGFLALAPDGLSYVGGALEDQEASRDRFAEADRDRITDDVTAALPYLAARTDCTGTLGAVGFCYGGGVAMQCAARSSAVKAGVCFYGRALSAEEVDRVEAPLMMHYACDDPRVNEGIPAFRALLDEKGVAYSLNMYPGTGHGFHNDTSAARYNAEAAGLAWERTLDFFATYLR